MRPKAGIDGHPRTFRSLSGTMIRLSTFTPRMWLILAHDLIATVAQFVAACRHE